MPTAIFNVVPAFLDQAVGLDDYKFCEGAEKHYIKSFHIGAPPSIFVYCGIAVSMLKLAYMQGRLPSPFYVKELSERLLKIVFSEI